MTRSTLRHISSMCMHFNSSHSQGRKAIPAAFLEDDQENINPADNEDESDDDFLHVHPHSNVAEQQAAGNMSAHEPSSGPGQLNQASSSVMSSIPAASVLQENVGRAVPGLQSIAPHVPAAAASPSYAAQHQPHVIHHAGHPQYPPPRSPFPGQHQQPDHLRHANPLQAAVTTPTVPLPSPSVLQTCVERPPPPHPQAPLPLLSPSQPLPPPNPLPALLPAPLPALPTVQPQHPTQPPYQPPPPTVPLQQQVRDQQIVRHPPPPHHVPPVQAQPPVQNQTAADAALLTHQFLAPSAPGMSPHAPPHAASHGANGHVSLSHAGHQDQGQGYVPDIVDLDNWSVNGEKQSSLKYLKAKPENAQDI